MSLKGRTNCNTGIKLPPLENPASASNILSGKEVIDGNGEILTGTMPSISISAPSISVNSNGLITASNSWSTGYTSSGSNSNTYQLSTQAGVTITPGTSSKVAVSRGRYTTGTIYVAGDSDLKASNIRSGINIFGITGNYAGASNTYYQFDENDLTYSLSTTYGSNGHLRLTLPTTPNTIVAYWFQGQWTPDYSEAGSFTVIYPGVSGLGYDGSNYPFYNSTACMDAGGTMGSTSFTRSGRYIYFHNSSWKEFFDPDYVREVKLIIGALLYT